MKIRIVTFLIVIIALPAIAFALVSNSRPSMPKADNVALSMQRVADWQIAHFRDAYTDKEPHHVRSWPNGALYVGMLKWADISGDGRYLEWLRDVAEHSEWDLHTRTYMADDHVVGQMLVELYRKYGDVSMLEKTRQRLDYIMANPSQQPIEIGKYRNLDRWTWCDALFMGPPLWAKMSAITGDSRYRDWMYKEFIVTTDHLFDKKSSLYYRDDNYIGQSKDGKKIFWARGNGWVFAGLALIMDELPENSSQYKYYKKIYKKMAATLIKIQTPEGHWAMSLLNAENYPTPETSGSSFFTYGLAWGVNNGILKKEKYAPSIYKAWQALTSHITEDGMLGYVQPIGAAPGKAWPDKTEVYGTGAFLAAGAEVYQLVGGMRPVSIPRSSTLEKSLTISAKALKDETQAKQVNKPATFGRFVPERLDDFAWENDLVAFRAYGPALREDAVSAGIDCWPKRVKYPIINKWYHLATTKNISYHEDHGEGLDNYHVGPSAGCGGTAIWLDGKRQPLNTYVSWSVHRNSGKRIDFTLRYEDTIDGKIYKEHKRITLELGSRLYRAESTFWRDGELAINLPIAVAVATHDGKAAVEINKSNGWLAAWENIDGSGFGTGIVVDPSVIRDTQLVQEEAKDSGHALMVINTDQNGQISYYSGYGWEKAKEISSAQAWEQYLDAFSKKLAK